MDLFQKNWVWIGMQSQRKHILEIVKKKQRGRWIDWQQNTKEPGRKWIVLIMLWLFEGDKSQWKIHLKALLLFSLIPAGGLGSTEFPPKHVQEGAVVKCWLVYWCRVRTEGKCIKENKNRCFNCLAEVAFRTTQYKVVLNY